jgi:hypothetical protein
MKRSQVSSWSGLSAAWFGELRHRWRGKAYRQRYLLLRLPHLVVAFVMIATRPLIRRETRRRHTRVLTDGQSHIFAIRFEDERS